MIVFISTSLFSENIFDFNFPIIMVLPSLSQLPDFLFRLSLLFLLLAYYINTFEKNIRRNLSFSILVLYLLFHEPSHMRMNVYLSDMLWIL